MNSTPMRRVRQACANCRDRHIRCDGMHPCYSCELRGITCQFKRRPEQPHQILNHRCIPVRSSLASPLVYADAPTLPSHRPPYAQLVGAASHVLNAPHTNMPRTFSDVVLTMYQEEVANTSMRSSITYDMLVGHEVWRLLTEGGSDHHALTYTQLAEGLVYGVPFSIGSRVLKDDQRTAAFSRKAEEMAFEIVTRRKNDPNLSADDANSAVPILEAMMQLFAFHFGNGDAQRGRLVAVIASQFIDSVQLSMPAELRFKCSVAMFCTSQPEHQASYMTNILANWQQAAQVVRIDAALMLTCPLVEDQVLPSLTKTASPGVNESIAEYLHRTGEALLRPDLPTDRRIVYEAVIAGARAVHLAKTQDRNAAYEMVRTCLDFARTMDLSMAAYQTVTFAVVQCVHISLELGFTTEAVRGLSFFRPFLGVLKSNVLHLFQQLQQNAQSKGIHAPIVKQEPEAPHVAPLGYGSEMPGFAGFPSMPQPLFQYDDPNWSRHVNNTVPMQPGQLHRRTNSMPVHEDWHSSGSGSSPFDEVMMDTRNDTDVDSFLQ